MNAREIEQIFNLVLAGWPTQRQRMSEEDIAAMALFHADGLSDLDFAVTKAAVLRLGRTAKYMPQVADIREAVGHVHHGLQTPGAEAYGELHAAIRKYGSHRTPGVDFSFSDPITRRVVASFGWFDICASASPDHIRARFIDAYDEIAKLERKTAQLAPGGKNPELGAPRPIARIEREGKARSMAQLLGASEEEK